MMKFQTKERIMTLPPPATRLDESVSDDQDTPSKHPDPPKESNIKKYFKTFLESFQPPLFWP